MEQATPRVSSAGPPPPRGIMTLCDAASSPSPPRFLWCFVSPRWDCGCEARRRMTDLLGKTTTQRVALTLNQGL